MLLPRRPLLAGLALTAVARPVLAQAPRRVRIGFLSAASQEDAVALGYLRRYLAALGWREGDTLTIDDRHGGGDVAATPALVAALIASRPDIIVVTGSAESRLTAAATQDIPIVFLQVSDPVGLGLVQSLARPGGNVTGAAATGQLLWGKRIELLQELLPATAVRGVALLANPGNPITARLLPDLAANAARLGVAQRMIPVRQHAEIAPAIASVAAEEAVLVQHDFVLFPARRLVVAQLKAARKPAIFENRFSPMAGGLCSYGADLRENYRLGAIYVDRILRGAKPADLPVVLPNKLEFVINSEAAAELGISVPPALLARADEVIE